MRLETREFGRLSTGERVTAWKLARENGMALTLLDYGATIQSLFVPDRSGTPIDVVLGYDTAEEYEKGSDYLGATIGRMANRIGGGVFTLAGRTYHVAQNDGENHLHGGVRGFDKHLWDVTADGESLICSRVSPDGEEGYPGNLTVTVRFTLTDDALTIDYTARTDKDTIVSLTNHSYFHLAGGGSVLGHILKVNAGRFLQNDAHCLPTGKTRDVAGTAFDFRTPKPIGRDLASGDENLSGGGYDHTFILSDSHAAEVFCNQSGIRLRVETDLPGMQVYTANSLTPCMGKRGQPMAPHGAICLETQLFPDAMAHYGFPSPRLAAGQTMHTQTRFIFDVL